PGMASAAWSGNASASGQAQAASMPAGSAPAVSATGHNVTVNWSGGTLLGQSVTGYAVKRYSAGHVAQTVGSGCSGTIAVLSCTESAVPAGTWTYTVTPLLYSWLGTESAASAAVTVEAPGLSITSATTVTSLPATVSASLSGYTAGQTVTFKLDSASGTTLTSTLSPTSIPAGGAATATITLPAGTAQGTHAIYAVGSQGDSASASLTVNRPVVSGAVIAKSAGGISRAIKKGGTYYVYAAVAGSGTPPAGLGSLSADVSTITTGQTAAAMSWGSYTIDGQSYNYRSAQLTAKSTLSAGSDSFTVKLTDSAGTATTSTYSVTVDNTAPRASDIQTANVSGGTAGKPELGDTVTFTYTKTIDPDTVLAGWDGSSQTVVVNIIDGGASTDDKLDVLNASTMAQLPLGTIDLGRKDYVSKTTTFGASGTPATMALSGTAITLTLGTPSATAGTAASTGTMIWTPSSTVTDPAGNAMSTTAVSESGTADKDF
ncbi:MAG: hypothetical protein WAU75_19870, partial [Solirubrobacteraceae bacterium]